MSTSSAVEQIVSAVPALAAVAVVIGVVAIGLITLGNLRGLREAGNIFAIPTYLFLVSAFVDDRAGRVPDRVPGRHRAGPHAEVVAAMSQTARERQRS